MMTNFGGFEFVVDLWTTINCRVSDLCSLCPSLFLTYGIVTMASRELFFVLISLCTQGVMPLKTRSGIRGQPPLQRELGARPNVTTFPTFEPNTSEEPNGAPSFSPTESFKPSSPTMNPSLQPDDPSPSLPPVTLSIPTSDQTDHSSPSQQPTSPSPSPSPHAATRTPSPPTAIPSPTPQTAIPDPSLPPVSIRIPTTDELSESGLPSADSSNGAVGAQVKSRAAGPNMISAAAITGLVLGLSGLCVMGFVSSRRHGKKEAEAEVMGSATNESSH